jgi:hypothetical protein
MSGDTEGIVLSGDERDFVVAASSGVGVLDGESPAEGTKVVPAPITITSSFDIARLF